MLKGSDLIGIPISIDQHTDGERIANWILDVETNQLLGFVIKPGGWTGGARILLWEHVLRVTTEKVITACTSPVIEVSKVFKIKDVLENQPHLPGHTVLTRKGINLGEIIDVYFDEMTGMVKGLTTLLKPRFNGGNENYCFLSVLEPLEILDHFVIATPAMLDSIEAVYVS